MDKKANEVYCDADNKIHILSLTAEENARFSLRHTAVIGITNRCYKEYQCGSCGVKYAESDDGFDPKIQCWCQSHNFPVKKTLYGLDNAGCEMYEYQCSSCGVKYTHEDDCCIFPRVHCYCRPGEKGPVIETVRHEQFTQVRT